ncbi:MAG: UDP-N-acetylmuramate dehydrogenase [bacterium]
MNRSGLEKELRSIADARVESGHVLAPHTSYRIGGPAVIWVEPDTEEAVGRVLKVVHASDEKLFVLGGGSNVLISDEGWDGVVLHIGRNLSGWEFTDTRATVLAGTVLLDFIRESVSRGLAGMELMAGIPGSVGGGLRMNAGAFGQEVESTVREVRGFLTNGEPVVYAREAIDFGYRNAPELERVVVTSATFEFTEQDTTVLADRVQDILELRAEKQPLEYPSCGSVFKRPPGYYAGALIEEVGFKGRRHGKAQVSEKHAGFILNTGGATAREVLELMEMVAATVRERFGVELEREVKLIGFSETVNGDS